MAWYSTGTVSVTNGGTTVNGAGTGWFGALQDGWGFVGPDGRAYEIASVTEATTLVLDTPYQGATASGQSYACFPTNSLREDLASAFQTIQSTFQGYIDTSLVGKFLDGTLALPGITFVADTDTGLRRPASNRVALVAGGVDQLDLVGGVASGAAVQSGATDVTPGRLMLAQHGFGPGNLLGTVSQSGGVPTGAVIERGSNANGEYVKVADGTMFCQHFVASALSSNVATGNIFTSADYTWTFPAPFITSTDAYVACTPLTSANVWGKGRTTATTTGVARLYSSASTGAVSISLYASGRWFT
ncbi:hypothetical protein [Aestuariivita sp.]|jgi:hypothetical protein|uniref:hypothetical protein n=1 Tax=Aestuariivita sp. TaxID=1872407 RepID=UPI00216EFE9E|nr:hypothetical protein [Aestuariivita sp.]MCE8006556.1 hypothetical protein [Aestuariivita sp.]